MRRAGSAPNHSPSRSPQRNQRGVKTTNLTKKPLILSRAQGTPSNFSWSLRGADTHSVSQVYLSLFAALAQIREPLPNSIRVVPDTIIFRAGGPTTWFAFHQDLRRVMPHAAIDTTAQNIHQYFSEVMKSRETVNDMSNNTNKNNNNNHGENSSPTSGSPRFPCAVWMFDAVDVQAQDRLAEQDRHVCVEYLDLAGVQALVDRLVSGPAPNGVLQEFVACDVSGFSGSSEEHVVTCQIPPQQQQQDQEGSHNNNSNNHNNNISRPGITSPSTGLLELVSVFRFKNMHPPRKNLGLDQLISFQNSNNNNNIPSATPISTRGFCAIPPVTLVYQTVEIPSPVTDFLTCVVREPEEVVQELRSSPPGWQLSVSTPATASLGPMLPSSTLIYDVLKTSHQIITALTRDRDHLGELNNTFDSGVVMTPHTKCSLWLKPLPQEIGGGFALLGVSAMRIPPIRLDYTFIDADSILALTSHGQDVGAQMASSSMMEKSMNNNNNNGNKKNSPSRGNNNTSRGRNQTPTNNNIRNRQATSSPVPSPRQNQQQPLSRTFTSTTTPRPTSATNQERRLPPPTPALNQGVRHQDIAGLSRNPTSYEQNVDRMYEHNNNNNTHHQQLPPRPTSALQYNHNNNNHVNGNNNQNNIPSRIHTPAPPPTRPTSANPMLKNNFNRQEAPNNNFSTPRAPPPPPLSNNNNNNMMMGVLKKIGDNNNTNKENNNSNNNNNVNPHSAYALQAKNNQQQIDHVYFSKVTEKEMSGIRASEAVQTKPYTQPEQSEEVSCPNCGEWQSRNNCYTLNYHTIAAAVKKSQKNNERHLKGVFPRMGQFTAQRQALSLDAVRTSHSDDLLFDDAFAWAPLPPVLRQLKVDVDDLVGKDVWRQRTVLLCASCAFNLYDKEDAELTERLNRLSHARKNSFRSASAVLRKGTSRNQLDLSMRAASPEQVGVDYLVGNNHASGGGGGGGSGGGVTFSSFAIPPFNAAHSQIAAKHSIHERPPPASVFSNVTDALVTTDLQKHHREIRQARRDKYAMRLVAADCHRGVDVFSATLAKQREIENLLHSLILPLQDLGVSSQIDDSLSLILSRELFASITSVCKEPAELALGVVMSRPAKGKGPWRIPKPMSSSYEKSLESSGARKSAGGGGGKNVKKSQTSFLSSSYYEDELAALEASFPEEDEHEMEFCPLPVGDERPSDKRKRLLREQKLLFSTFGGPTSSSSISKRGSPLRDHRYSHKKKGHQNSAYSDDITALMMGARIHTYNALSAGSQTFSEMNQNERDAIVQFLGSEGSILGDDDDDDGDDDE